MIIIVSISDYTYKKKISMLNYRIDIPPVDSQSGKVLRLITHCYEIVERLNY